MAHWGRSCYILAVMHTSKKSHVAKKSTARVVSRRVTASGGTTWRVIATNGHLRYVRASTATKAALKEASELYSGALERLAKR